MADRNNSPHFMTNPAEIHTLVVPNDFADLPYIPRALRCNVAGTCTIVDKLGTSLLYNVLQGEVMVFRGVRIMATGTTATMFTWD